METDQWLLGLQARIDWLSNAERNPPCRFNSNLLTGDTIHRRFAGKTYPRLERHRRLASALLITKEAGLFEKNGLDVTMIYVDGGSKATQALMSGDVPIAQVGGNAPVVARLRGADVTLIAGLLNVLAYSMIVSPEIKKPEDLRGKKLFRQSLRLQLRLRHA